MNKYQLRLDKIISKHFILNESINTSNPINLIGKIIRDKCENKKFAIWGAGEHTIQLHKYLSVEIKNAKFIIDNNEYLSGSEILGFKVVHPSMIKEDDIDVILISSYAGANSIEEQIKNMNLKCEVVNFYKTLKEMGTRLGGPFFSNSSIYIELYNLKNKYEESNTVSKKEEFLIKIIFLYLQLKDFYNAKIFINKYLKFNFSNKEKYKNLLKEIDDLIQDLKYKLKNRNGKDIVLMFLDSLRAKDVYDKNSPMKYLNGILKDSIYLTKAYSPSITTYESVPSMFLNSMPFVNELYKRNTIRQNECEFIKLAINKGYKIKIYTLGHWNIINGSNIQYGEESNYSAETLWNSLIDLANSIEENTIYLLYFWQETHSPHIGGHHTKLPQGHVTPFTCNDKIEQTQEEYSKQYRESLTYIDNQLEFYGNIISNNTIKLIFSDHGQIIDKALQPLENIGTLVGWHTLRYNVPLIINGGNIEPKKINDMYSTKNLGNIIKSIIENDLNINTSDVVEINFSKINNSIIINNYKNKGYDDYLYGFKVFLSEKYKVVITGNEKIKVYENNDEFNEIKDEVKIKRIIKYFKDKNCNFSIPNFN